VITQHEFKEYLEDKKGLLNSLSYDNYVLKRAEIQKELENQEIWNDSHKVGMLNQELGILEGKIEGVDRYRSLLEDLQVAYDLEDEKAFENINLDVLKAYEHLQNQNFLNGKFDTHNCIVSLHAGAGGVDAMDFAAMLASMYQAFCKRENFDYNVVSISPGDEGGIKSMSFEISGKNAYGYLKEEVGVHRLVRISPFNSGKTRETSFALVEVIPADLENEIVIDLDDKDIRWDFYQASGKGGQSVNTTYSAVRLVHIPTGITVTCQNERSQVQNKAQAMKYLKNKLVALELKKQKDLENELKGAFVSAEWGSQIRNYVLHPYKLVKDVRSGWETNDVNRILEEGDLMPIIWSVKKTKTVSS
jgi:peptide chain release factor 2